MLKFGNVQKPLYFHDTKPPVHFPKPQMTQNTLFDIFTLFILSDSFQVVFYFIFLILFLFFSFFLSFLHRCYRFFREFSDFSLFFQIFLNFQMILSIFFYFSIIFSLFSCFFSQFLFFSAEAYTCWSARFARSRLVVSRIEIPESAQINAQHHQPGASEASGPTRIRFCAKYQKNQHYDPENLKKPDSDRDPMPTPLPMV